MSYHVAIAVLAIALPAAALAKSNEIRLEKGSAAVTGSVTFGPGCEPGEAQLFVSVPHKGQDVLLYQAAAMPGSTFEFHVMPGQHEVSAISMSGCVAEAKLRANPNEVKRLALTLAPPTRKAETETDRKPASSGMTYCHYCFTGSPQMSILPFVPDYSPYWVPYGRMSYPNFYAPAPWIPGGINGMWYPGQGNVWMNGGAMMGKPNVYVSAPKGTKLEIDVEMKRGSNLLAAVPVHGKQGWTATVEGPYQLRSGDSQQAFLFYDYRLNPSSFQKEEGFCATREKILPELTRHLELAGFEPYEVKDFKDYWGYKLPNAETFCVFPQDERQLSKASVLRIAPAPEAITRVGFLVVPSEPGVKPRAFHERPTKQWKPHFRAASGRIVPIDELKRAPASESSVRVREWGVGFLRGL